MSAAPDRSGAPAALVPLPAVALPLLVGFLAEVPGWVLIAADWPSAGAWYGPPVLRVGIHLVTVGGLLLPIVGAGWQLVPVVTTRPFGAWARRVVGWVDGLVVGGALLLWTGLAGGWGIAAIGALGVVFGLLLRAGVLLPALLRARGRLGVRAWLVGAELALLGGLGLAVHLLGAHLGVWPPGNLLDVVSTHARWMAAGWAGGTVVGLSALLLPMFALGREPPPWPFAALALLWFLGLLPGAAVAWALAAALGVLLLGRATHAPRRAAPGAAWGGGPGLVQARLGLLGLGAAAGATLAGCDGPLIGALLLAGWILPTQHGLATRIVPFLLWAHILADLPAARRPPPARLVSPGLAWAQVGVSSTGAVGWIAAIALDLPPLARAGALALALGALLHVATVAGAAVAAFSSWRRAGALPGTEAP